VQQVITAEQAKQITRGRTPLVPVEYETAIKALTECVTLDEAKYWSDKSDALAAWAKIYHSNDAQRKAKLLKMHAFRRMGEIAAEIRPQQKKGGGRPGGGAGSLPGPISLLQEHGLGRNEAGAARRLALLPDRQFQRLLKNPKAPTTLMHELWSESDPVWRAFSQPAMTLRSFCRRTKAADVAAVCNDSEQYAGTAREIVRELTEWLDDLDQRISAKKRKAA
jgi:hypothetical protein